MSKAAWNRLRKQVVNCQKCPRLTAHCQKVALEKRKAYADETYWGKPVPNFGRHQAALLVVGLAPGAHGANRTGRMFTGDRSGDWLFRAMFETGFASQAESTGKRDGLSLIDAAITNAGRCAPPGNKPTAEEIANCRPYFEETLRLTEPRVIIALGGLAWNETFRTLSLLEWYRPAKRPKFGHGVTCHFQSERNGGDLDVLGCYHPSQQNTFTGRLTRPMLKRVFAKARRIVDR